MLADADVAGAEAVVAAPPARHVRDVGGRVASHDSTSNLTSMRAIFKIRIEKYNMSEQFIHSFYTILQQGSIIP